MQENRRINTQVSLRHRFEISLSSKTALFYLRDSLYQACCLKIRDRQNTPRIDSMKTVSKSLAMTTM